ncbi:Putative ribonuclease H protein At1g65750 [Linum grandiflorum]
MRPAKVVWPLHSSGAFSVRSFMKVLRKQTFPGEDDFPASCIWRKEVPKKIQGFMWLVYLGRILTMDNLQKRGLIAPNRCSLCKRAAESIDHIFLECSYSQKIWNRFSSTLSFTGPHYHIMTKVIKGWKGMNFTVEFDLFRGVFLHAFYWFIWLERNGRIFKNIVRSDIHVAHKIFVCCWVMIVCSKAVFYR